MTETIIPAQPGWFAVLVVHHRDSNPPTLPRFTLERVPIIAWAITRHEPQGLGSPATTIIEPITHEGGMDMVRNSWGVLRPDGLIDYQDETFTDENRMIDFINENRD